MGVLYFKMANGLASIDFIEERDTNIYTIIGLQFTLNSCCAHFGFQNQCNQKNICMNLAPGEPSQAR